MASASNHQPVLLPVAQRGTPDDCTKFVVSGNGKTINAAANNGDKGIAAAAAAQSAVDAGPGAIESSTASAAAAKDTAAAAKAAAGKGANANAMQERPTLLLVQPRPHLLELQRPMLAKEPTQMPMQEKPTLLLVQPRPHLLEPQRPMLAKEPTQMLKHRDKPQMESKVESSEPVGSSSRKYLMEMGI